MSHLRRGRAAKERRQQAAQERRERASIEAIARWQEAEARLGCNRKRAHPTEDVARRVAIDCMRERPDEPLRWYACPRCGGWHLTRRDAA